MAGSGASVGVGGAPSDFVTEGERRCLCRYDDEDSDLGGCDLPVFGERMPSSPCEDLRLTEGVLDFDDAGDCCDGGVYGMSFAQAGKMV